MCYISQAYSQTSVERTVVLLAVAYSTVVVVVVVGRVLAALGETVLGNLLLIPIPFIHY